MFDRRFIFRAISMGHSQFAELIGARGPNTQVNAACASTTQAIAIAEDWIATGRCRRVVIVSADDV
jgi:3-oxoacyl-(acyl-carrier-protein) synthase